VARRIPCCAPTPCPQAGTFYPARLTGPNPLGRLRARVSARVGVASLWVAVLGRAGRPLEPPLGVQPAAIPKAARWHGLLNDPQES
jgi:hypothetical protein